jgi:glycosyltransferase involved in cell wall biosynthesis
MIRLSVIIPVFNRPDELRELLESIEEQKQLPHEILVVEDGSTITCETVVRSFSEKLPLKYFFKENEGQGFARNFGFERAGGDYFIVFDSDCMLPPHYFQVVTQEIEKRQLDAFGDPDKARDDFTVIQKAINQAMTSFLTTGGIRGRKINVGRYHPRSFNMGFSKEVYHKIGGYRIPFMGEDIEFSTRLLNGGFNVGLIEDAYVYHKRRTDFGRFYKQLKYFGRARINVSRFHPNEVKLVHLFPTAFLMGLFLAVLLIFMGYPHLMALYGVYFLLIFIEALIVSKNLKVALLTPLAALLQLIGYGYGLMSEWVRKLRGIDPNAPYVDLY